MAEIQQLLGLKQNSTVCQITPDFSQHVPNGQTNESRNFRVIGNKIFWRAQTFGSLACTAVHVVCVLDKYGAGAIVNRLK
jgi:hypothetical protein